MIVKMKRWKMIIYFNIFRRKRSQRKKLKNLAQSVRPLISVSNDKIRSMQKLKSRKDGLIAKA